MPTYVNVQNYTYFLFSKYSKEMFTLFTFTPLLTVTYDTGGVTTLLEKKK